MKPLLLNEIKNILHAEMKTPITKGLVTGVSIDSRTIQPEELFVAIRGDQFDGHEYIEDVIASGVKAVIIDRSIPIPQSFAENDVCVMKVECSRKALGQLARHYRRSLGHGVMVIAVTGSNGKTTTREMIYHILSQHKKGHRSPKNFNNDIGVPLSIFGIEPDHDFVVLEIASNQPGEIAELSRIAEPDVSVITSIAPSHLDGFKNVDGVMSEKISIVSGMPDRGVVICSQDDPVLLERLKPQDRHLITFGFDVQADISVLEYDRSDSGMTFVTNDHCRVNLPVLGKHNVSNALAALATVRRMGLTSHDFANAMTNFQGVSQRMAVKQANGISVIDDSYNANPSSMAAALKELAYLKDVKRRVLIIGDMEDLGANAEEYHRQLGIEIANSNVDLLLAVGPKAAIAANTAIEHGMGLGSVQRSINSKRLARLVKSLLLDDDVVLVKGSRSMEMEKVVESLMRYRRKNVVKSAGIVGVSETAAQKRKRKATS